MSFRAMSGTLEGLGIVEMVVEGGIHQTPSMERALLHFFTLVQMFMSLGSWQTPSSFLAGLRE